MDRRLHFMRGISLGLILLAFWLALSGHYTVFLVAAGAASALVAVVAAIRMRLMDAEGHPIELLPRAMTYWPWLLWEIVKSAWAVTKIVLSPSLPISPTMTVVQAGQKTNAGVATYANSITLTPGTMTVKVEGQKLTVHALTREGANDLEEGAMNLRVIAFESAT